jgi:hypothetical protein
MKKTIALCLMMSVGIFAIAQQAAVQGPAIEVNEEVHDFGTIPFNSDGNYTFTVTNTGTEPLIISECTRSCGCTTPKCDATPVPPGGTTVVQVHYDTKRVGPFNKSITIKSNAVNEPIKVLHIKGTVEPDEAAKN